MQKTIQETRKPAPGAPVTRGRQQAVKPKTVEEVVFDEKLEHDAEVERLIENANNIVKLAVSRLQALTPEEAIDFSTEVEVEGHHYEVHVVPARQAAEKAQESAAGESAPASPVVPVPGTPDASASEIQDGKASNANDASLGEASKSPDGSTT